MNKISKGLCMIAVVAMAFTSCKKDNTPTNSVVFNHTMQQLVTVNDENEFEKVYLDPTGYIAYELGDRLMLFDIHDGGTGSANALYELVTTSNETLLTVVSGETELPGTTTGAYYAFYPGENVVATDLANGNRATFRLDATQTYRANTSAGTMLPKGALYIAAKGTTVDHAGIANNWDDAYFYCDNICGVLRLNLFCVANKKVRSIEVTDNAFNIVGDVELKIDEVDPDYMTSLFNRYDESDAYQSELAAYLNRLGYNTSNTGNTVTLDCGNGVTLGKTKATATPFYIVMRPLALMKGCTIKVNFTNGTSKTIKSSKNNVIKPNMIRNMTAVAVG